MVNVVVGRMSIFVERDWDRCCIGLLLNMGRTHMLSLEPVEDYRFFVVVDFVVVVVIVADFVVVLFSRFPSCALSFCSCSHFCKCIIIRSGHSRYLQSRS